jgi:glycosyltransferase involved in cell wall biosynthesis
VFHGTDFAVPYLSRCASVLTLHDLSPWATEPWRAASSRVRRRTPLLLRFGFATMIVTPTEAIRRSAIERFRLAPERVVATPLAAAACFRPANRVRPARPYFLFAGTLDARKNVDIIVGAWREIRAARDVDLVLAGRSGTAPVRPEPGLVIARDLTDEALAELYSHATAFLFPSHYEGFGLPVLEAMQCGAPVIASRDPAVMEVAGDSAALIDAGDAPGWKRAMERALEDDAWREDMIRRGYRRVSCFSWERTASLTRDVYQEAIGRFAAHA